MNNNPLKASDLVTMKQFEGGWIWMKNIKEFSQNAISTLEKNEGRFDLDKITQKIKGELITDWKIYDDTEWIIKFQPFMNDYLLFIYNKNEEFGSEIKIFFNKQFLKEVPTEDAYCFVELYLKQLIRYINTPIHETLISGDNLIIDELLDIVDKENKETVFQLGKYEFTAKHSNTLGYEADSRNERWTATGAMIIQTGKNEFYLAGSGIVLTFKEIEKQNLNVGILKAEEGKFENNTWKVIRHLNGDQTHQGRHVRILLGDGFSIQRFKLYHYK